jgi:hypothetical protein
MGLYAVIKFIPSLERQEPVNVGVAVAENNVVELRFVQRDEIGDWSPVARFESLLRHELESPTRVGDGEDFLRDLHARRFGHFVVTEPRFVATNQNAGAYAQQLVRDLVELPVSAF